MITIKPESPAHRDAIRRLTETAFAASPLGLHGEADLIDAIRAGSDGTLSLVAIQDAKIVGHILFSPVSIHRDETRLDGMGLAPMSVLPALQRNGIGSRLVTAGLRRLSALGTPFIVVAGHPDFYSRLGFAASRDFRITHGFAGMPQDFFLIHANDRQALRDVRGGLAYYLPEFGPQHESAA